MELIEVVELVSRITLEVLISTMVVINLLNENK